MVGYSFKKTKINWKSFSIINERKKNLEDDS